MWPAGWGRVAPRLPDQRRLLGQFRILKQALQAGHAVLDLQDSHETQVLLGSRGGEKGKVWRGLRLGSKLGPG